MVQRAVAPLFAVHRLTLNRVGGGGIQSYDTEANKTGSTFNTTSGKSTRLTRVTSVSEGQAFRWGDVVWAPDPFRTESNHS